MGNNELSQEEINKFLKSLESIIGFVGREETNPEEMILINETILKTNEEMIELIKKQNAEWIDAYSNINNSFCKILIKNLTDKNFITLNELEEQKTTLIKDIEKYKKMI